MRGRAEVGFRRPGLTPTLALSGSALRATAYELVPAMVRQGRDRPVPDPYGKPAGEIARANGKPEWEGEIRNTFAQRWIEKASPG